MERTFISDSKPVIHRNTIKSTCTQKSNKQPQPNLGSKKYLTSKSSEVQKAQDHAPKHTECTTTTEKAGRAEGREITATKTQVREQCHLLPFTVTYFVVLFLVKCQDSWRKRWIIS